MTAIYASQSDVEPLIKFISDDASTDLFDTVLSNADNWINARLLSNSLSVWNSQNTQNVPELLKTAATYYAASDIILALYNGEELPTQFDAYFNKAELMVDAYITQQKDELASTELKDRNMVKHHKGLTYYQRKQRR